ncbi:SSU rRNA (adenine(1518)-N(6)/adenine(1519)-N(6))-dimethyltransferase [hydrothermal vent metagenome]|uniref:SSU rRNA (Adenine(1518)-N(6)/adenine(1519)-N(6))-dimethyltransferase n=1 Tax=hydrothermal vent metagenome TaxID=652676 RepID=A0A1W1B8P9_9ZZZZ
MIKAKKKFGQNFLKDESVLTKIIESMPNNDNKIAEIGPGLGDLTKYLVNVKSVEAFEVDTELCVLLQERFEKELADGRLHLHCKDVLEVWQESLLKRRYDLVANLPYYIATNIVLKALADEKCENILVMVQLEVAQKFCAKSGQKEFGALSVIAQSIAECRITQIVPPSSFEPAPKVDSAVMLLSKRTSRSDEGFERFLRICFKQPRKTLAKNLSSTYNKEKISDILKELDLSSTIRPHELSTDDYHQLYTLLK